jgi:SagB-type dehydrogenase family enzyme
MIDQNPKPKEEQAKFLPFVYPTIGKTLLSRGFAKSNLSFLDVFLSRRSINDLSGITILKLSEVLYYSCKTQYILVDESGFLLSKRASPSAGALHPIDILVSPSPLSGIRNLSFYNPTDHSLNELKIEKEILQEFFTEVNDNVRLNDASLIWFSIQPEKTSSKYDNSESLIWRDTGALLYCIQITCTYLGLSSCPLGTLAANTFHSLFATQSLIPGGGILIGKNSMDE